jgi:hypothetical protein
MKHLEILPGTGLGDIRFGMTREEVSAILGDPAEIDMFSDDEPGNQVESWHYDEADVSFAFEEAEEWRLTTIAVSSEDYKIEDTTLIGLSKDATFVQLEKMGIDHNFDEDSGQDLHFSNETGLNFWMDGDVLREIQWSVEIDDEDKVIWPS